MVLERNNSLFISVVYLIDRSRKMNRLERICTPEVCLDSKENVSNFQLILVHFMVKIGFREKGRPIYFFFIN